MTNPTPDRGTSDGDTSTPASPWATVRGVGGHLAGLNSTLAVAQSPAFKTLAGLQEHPSFAALDAVDEDDLFTHWSQRSAIRSAVSDEAAKASRRRLCRELVAAFERAGQVLITTGHIMGPGRVDGTSPFGNGDDALAALGQLSSAAAALIRGAVELLNQTNCYAASALTRQLVEVEYLSWAFAEDREEAASWLRSSHQERLARWQPRHLRKRSRGRFRGSDYSEHCEVGGHPSPNGIRSLISGREQETVELLFGEVALHGASSWAYLLDAISACTTAPHLGSSPIPADIAESVDAARRAWDDDDHLAATWLAVKAT